MDKFIARTMSLSVEKISCIRFSVVYIIFMVHWFYLGFISFVDFFFSVYCYVQMDGKKKPTRWVVYFVFERGLCHKSQMSRSSVSFCFWMVDNNLWL